MANRSVLLDRANYWRRAYYNRTGDSNNLTLEQETEIKSYWGSWYKDLAEMDTIFHSFYYEKTGKYNVKYMPVDLYYCYIDPYFNNWTKAKVIDNKGLYPLLFHNVKQPKTFFVRTNGIWTDLSQSLISEEKMLDFIREQDELVVKQANESEGGKNIFFIKGNDIADQFKTAITAIKRDIVVQESIPQHEMISSINPTSINTIRVLSLLRQDEVKICSAIIRMGVNGSRVDNISKGGLACGITEEGRLKDKAYNYKGEVFTAHPTSHKSFNEIMVPNYDKVLNLVVNAHPNIPDFRLVSWDVAINKDGEPLLVEANLCYGELNLHQLCNGPVFGEHTTSVLKEVFGE